MVSLNLTLANGIDVSARAIIEAFISINWSPLDANGAIDYLPFGDGGMHDWEKRMLTIAQLLSVVDAKERNNEIIGVSLYWNNTDLGVVLLIHDPSTISLGIDINRKYLDEKTQTVDFNWYATNILQGLWDKLRIFRYSFEFMM